MLVPPPEQGNDFIHTSSLFFNRLAEALRVGAIPVIPGEENKLPFAEYIRWEKACVVIPKVSNALILRHCASYIVLDSMTAMSVRSLPAIDDYYLFCERVIAVG